MSPRRWSRRRPGRGPAGPGRRPLARAGSYALVVWAAVTVNFALPHLAGGDPVQYLYGGEAQALSPEQLAIVRAEYGLDRSVLEQYARFWAELGTGDLGLSISRNRPVAEVLAEQLPWTLALVGAAMLLAVPLGVGLGTLAARWRATRRETSLVSGMLAVDAMPGFWIGMIMIAVFAGWLGWFPSYGGVAVLSEPGWGSLADAAHRLVLPAVTLALAVTGGFFLLTRAAVVAALDEPHVRMARALGLPEHRVLARALRNALLPVWTNITVELGRLLSGVVVVESVFAYPGLGGLTYDAVTARDYPLLRGVFLLVTLVVVALNVVADLSYPLLDPRVRRSRAARFEAVAG